MAPKTDPLVPVRHSLTYRIDGSRLILFILSEEKNHLVIPKDE